MSEGVKVDIDLSSGRLGLECPESSVDSILARLEDFLPKFREQAQSVQRQSGHHALRTGAELGHSNAQAKVNNGPPAGTTQKRSSTPARAGGAPEARPEVQSLQLNVAEPGMLTWATLSKDWKKYLWILEAARKKDVDGLTNSEISYLMNKTFREVRAPKVVNNLKNKIKDRLVQSTTAEAGGKTYSIWRILADGSKEVLEPAGAVTQ